MVDPAVPLHQITCLPTGTEKLGLEASKPDFPVPLCMRERGLVGGQSGRAALLDPLQDCASPHLKFAAVSHAL